MAVLMMVVVTQSREGADNSYSILIFWHEATFVCPPDENKVTHEYQMKFEESNSCSSCFESLTLSILAVGVLVWRGQAC